MEKFIVFQIKTSYSEERYMCKFNDEEKNYFGSNMDENDAADKFLSDNCFCDAYEIIGVRDATPEEMQRDLYRYRIIY